MRLATRLRPARNTEDAIDPAHAAHARQVRQARLELARRQSNWTEIPESRLVQRGRFLVDAHTDAVFRLHRGVVFEPHRAAIGYVIDGTPMTYYVDTNDQVVFLEALGDRTWSEIVERQARRGKA